MRIISNLRNATIAQKIIFTLWLLMMFFIVIGGFSALPLMLIFVTVVSGLAFVLYKVWGRIDK